MSTIAMNKHINEGWTVADFIEELEPLADMIMNGQAIDPPFKNKSELTKWLKDNQPYYKKTIPEVVAYFCKKYSL